jgi:hypothetical protein
VWGRKSSMIGAGMYSRHHLAQGYGSGGGSGLGVAFTFAPMVTAVKVASVEAMN